MKKQSPLINLLVIGNINSGKSTTIGHLVYKLGNIHPQFIQQFEKEYIESGKYAWVLDQLKDERERGLPFQSQFRKFETTKFQFQVIETPGHRNYLQNMITGSSCADAAILVVNSTQGVFEIDFSNEGYIKEHISFAHSLGIKQMIVCINKMDEISVNFSQERYNQIKTQINQYMINIDINTEKIPFIPTSGLNGDNIFNISQNSPWYKGPILIEALDSLESYKSLSEKPLRITVQEVFKIQGAGQVFAGRVETGIIKYGMLLQFSPSQQVSEFRHFEIQHEPQDQYYPNDYVGFSIKTQLVKNVKRGEIISDSQNSPAKQCSSFQSLIVITDCVEQINAGQEYIVSIHNANIPCKIQFIHSKIDRRNGKVIKENPESLKNGDGGLITVIPTKPLCVEAFSEYPRLGRYTIRFMDKVFAVGIIIKVEKIKN